MSPTPSEPVTARAMVDLVLVEAAARRCGPLGFAERHGQACVIRCGSLESAEAIIGHVVFASPAAVLALAGALREMHALALTAEPPDDCDNAGDILARHGVRL